jgi:hypothetical protein
MKESWEAETSTENKEVENVIDLEVTSEGGNGSDDWLVPLGSTLTDLG